MPGAFVSHGWLPAVLPAHARRFRVRDAALAYTLECAGADLVPHGAEVEIGQLDDLSADAPVVVVPLNANITDSHARVRRIVGRVTASAEVRVRAAQTRAALERRGYRYVRVIPWDRDQPIHVGGRSTAPGGRMAERFPRRVLIVAHRRTPEPTVLEQTLLDAGELAGTRLVPLRPLVGTGTLVVLTSGHVLRVAIGAATSLIKMQADALQALAAAGPTPAVATRAPGLLGTARTGLARWSLERRLLGEHPSVALTAALAAECLDFLVALYGTRSARLMRREPRAVRQAELMTAYLPVETGTAIRELAQEIEEEVGALRTGFWHGDFWMNNLLVQGDRLVGVIDWAQGGPQGLPLVDLMNLEMIEALDPDVDHWGAAILEYLVPLAVRGPTARSREYLRRTGLDLTARQRHCLVAAYWLERVTHHLGVYLDRGRDPRWVQRNVAQVAAALAGSPFTAAAVRRGGTPLAKVAS